MSTSFVERIMFCCLSRYNLCLTMTFNIDISSHQKLATIYCSHRQNKTKWFDVWHNVFLYIVYLVFYIFECENPRSVGVVAYMLLSGGVSPFYSGAYLFIQTTTIRTPPLSKKTNLPLSGQCSAVSG